MRKCWLNTLETPPRRASFQSYIYVLTTDRHKLNQTTNLPTSQLLLYIDLFYNMQMEELPSGATSLYKSR